MSETQEPLYDLRLGNALEVLKTLPSESVHCCCTSPPYLGLRSYGDIADVWDAGPDCDHSWEPEARRGVPAGKQGSTSQRAGRSNVPEQEQSGQAQGSFCTRCPAWRGVLGLEPTLELYVAHLVLIFEEVRRVLRRDGTCWLNLGDSYCSSAGQGARSGSPKYANGALGRMSGPNRRAQSGLKPKDLMGVPWRCAFALQAAGWWLRAECIWDKPNGLPESVEDRPTRSHETVFLLTRSETYRYDAGAVRQPYSPATHSEIRARYTGEGRKRYEENGVQNPSDVKRSIVRRLEERGGSNLRSVWKINTEAYPDSHFATFPSELARRCILAGCPPGGVVLDPFMGTATTGVVALQHGRRFIGIERNRAYLPLAAERLKQYEGLGTAPPEATIRGPRTLSLEI